MRPPRPHRRQVPCFPAIRPMLHKRKAPRGSIGKITLARSSFNEKASARHAKEIMCRSPQLLNERNGPVHGARGATMRYPARLLPDASMPPLSRRRFLTLLGGMSAAWLGGTRHLAAAPHEAGDAPFTTKL